MTRKVTHVTRKVIKVTRKVTNVTKMTRKMMAILNQSDKYDEEHLKSQGAKGESSCENYQ